MKIQISRKTEIERKLYLSARYRGQRTRRKPRTWKKACSPLLLDLEKKGKAKPCLVPAQGGLQRTPDWGSSFPRQQHTRTVTETEVAYFKEGKNNMD